MNNPAVDKGKRRAPEGDERTPLLDPESSGRRESSSTPLRPQAETRNWNRRILTVALLSLTTLFFTALVFVVTSGYHYASWVAHVDPDQLVQQGVVLKYPSNIEVLQVTSDAVVVQVDGAAGIDADWIMGLEKQQDKSLIGPARRWFGRWLVERVDQITVTVADIRVYAPYSRTSHRLPDKPLITVATQPVTLPLTTRRRMQFGIEDDSWLTPLSIQLVLTPNPNGTVLMDYVEDALRMRRILARVEVDWVKVLGGEESHWWKPWSLFKVDRKDIEQIVRYEMPPNKPSGPSNDPVGSLVTLRSYSLHSNPSGELGLSAKADVLSPLPESLHGKLNHPLAFTVSLISDASAPSSRNGRPMSVPESAPIAQIMTGPISLTHPNITLSLAGTILPLQQESLPLISDFVSNFLGARSSPIMITSPAPFSVSVRTTFPGPKVKPKIIKSVNLQNMRLYPDPDSGEQLLAAATIIATIELPPGIQSLKLDVGKILPDVLVYDGPIPRPVLGSKSAFLSSGLPGVGFVGDDSPGDAFPPPPLPSPLPPRAFARIRPRYWLNSTSILQPDPVHPSTNLTIVTAQMKDVPLEVLPDRDDILRAFIQKVIFKGSALAGVRGDAAVRASIDGLALGGASLELKGLPVEGEFRIVRGGMLQLEDSPKFWS